jgi:hypothetical protein
VSIRNGNSSAAEVATLKLNDVFDCVADTYISKLGVGGLGVPQSGTSMQAGSQQSLEGSSSDNAKFPDRIQTEDFPAWARSWAPLALIYPTGRGISDGR